MDNNSDAEWQNALSAFFEEAPPGLAPSPEDTEDTEQFSDEMIAALFESSIFKESKASKNTRRASEDFDFFLARLPIDRRTLNAESALAFLRWMTSPENARRRALTTLSTIYAPMLKRR